MDAGKHSCSAIRVELPLVAHSAIRSSDRTGSAEPEDAQVHRQGYDIFVSVISTQEAFARAKQYATELLGEKEYTLEEVEQDVYKSRRVWRITVGFPKRRVSAPELMRSLGASLPLEYKTILVDIETGEPVAMKLAS